MAHGHAGHDHAPIDHGRAFAIGITINLAFAAAEAAAGLAYGSMALIADAGHNFSDVLGLVVAWVGAGLSKRAASPRFTWGYRGSTILASLANALLLLVALGAIVLEAFRRFADPVPAPGWTMIIVAAIGVAINAGTALMFAGGARKDLNIRAAYLHMAADAGVSVGVVIAGILVLATGAAWIDPAISILIAAIIFWNTWGLLRESVMLSLGAVPEGIDIAKVESLLASLPGVEAVHDLHVWPLGTADTVLSAHLVMTHGHPGNLFLVEAQAMLHERFDIGHVTLQIELEGGECGDCDVRGVKLG